MIYYQYKVDYINKQTTVTYVTATRSCEEIEYDENLNEIKNIIIESIIASNGELPNINEEIIFISEEEYNNIFISENDIEN